MQSWSHQQYLYSKFCLVLRGDFKRGLEKCGQWSIIDKLKLDSAMVTAITTANISGIILTEGSVI